jgi:hypothetical protein
MREQRNVYEVFLMTEEGNHLQVPGVDTNMISKHIFF